MMNPNLLFDPNNAPDPSFITHEVIDQESVRLKAIYFDMTGDLLASIMLAEMIDFYMPTRQLKPASVMIDDKLYFVCPRDQWLYGRLRPRTVDTGLAELQRLGFVEKVLKRYQDAPTLHVRVLWDAVNRAWAECVVKTAARLGFYENVKSADSDQDFEYKTPDLTNLLNPNIYILKESLDRKRIVTSDNVDSVERKKGTAQKAVKPRDARIDHPALKTFNEEMKIWPASGTPAPTEWLSNALLIKEGDPADWRDVIIDQVGDAPDQITAWRDALRAWKGVSNNRYNVAGCLKMFLERQGKKSTGANLTDKTRQQDRGTAEVSSGLRAEIRARQNRQQ